MLTQAAVRNLLKREVESFGSQRQAAIAFGLSPAYLCNVIKGAKPIGPKILRALKLKKVVTVSYVMRGRAST